MSDEYYPDNGDVSDEEMEAEDDRTPVQRVLDAIDSLPPAEREEVLRQIRLLMLPKE